MQLSAQRTQLFYGASVIKQSLWLWFNADRWFDTVPEYHVRYDVRSVLCIVIPVFWMIVQRHMTALRAKQESLAAESLSRSIPVR